MTSILNFNDSKNIEPKKNLINFIGKHKSNFIFSDSNKWNDNIWDITRFLEKKRTTARIKKVYFRSAYDNSFNKTNIEKPIPFPLMDFAKAVFCEIMSIKKLLEYKRIIYAIQALEHALTEQHYDICITQLNHETLNLAEIFIKKKYKDSWLIAKRIENIINNIIIKKNLNNQLFNWNTSINYTAPERSDRINNSGQQKNQKKLPNLEEILALADIHHSSQYIPDKVVTCFVVLALFAPSRGSEILTLPVDCLIKAPLNNGTITGITWQPLKDGQPLTKFAINEDFAILVTEAIDYLTNLGKEARIAAQWYIENPTKLYLPPEFKHLRNKPLTLWEITQILGKKTRIRGCDFRYYGVSKSIAKTTDKNRLDNKTAYWAGLYDFNELESFVISKLPPTFPILRASPQILWNESLFVLPKHILTPDAETLLNIPSPINIDQINKQLGSNPDRNTIFSRNKKKLTNGNAMYVTSHQFRHLLNTLAQLKALPQELIAFWSGRKSVKQNDFYNHVSQEAIIERFIHFKNETQNIPQHGYLGKKIQAIADKNMISYQDACAYELGSTHITRYGICRHDYSLTPCPHDKDCVKCGEFSVMKGNEQHRQEATQQVKMLETALLNAETAKLDGHDGAERWLNLNKPKLERWKKIKEFLEDDTVPTNTMLTLETPTESPQTKVGLAYELKNLK